MPSISFTNHAINTTLTESAIIATFLADSHPSHLFPASGASPDAPLIRARIAFFVDAYMNKVNAKVYAALMASESEVEGKAEEIASQVEKEIEPLLEDAGPFFGGAAKVSMAEVRFKSFHPH